MASTAAARRLSCSATTSTMVLREMRGSHKLSINGCKPFKKFDQGWAFDSKPFRVGGHSWRIKYYPHGYEGHISLYLELDSSSAIKEANDVKFKFSLLDQSGNPVPRFTRATTEAFCFSSHHGFGDFVRWEDLEDSGCVKDDTFTVQCDLTLTTDVGSTAASDDATPSNVTPATAAAAPAPAPTPKLHGEHHLTDLMWKHKVGADVTIDVGGGEATFDAHGWLLAVHSYVLQAELMMASKKSAAAGGANRRIEIEGVDPKVFEAALHYMYTNELPEMGNGDDAVAMGQGLLAAANRFKIQGLRMKCEKTLSRRIDVSTAAGTLALAKQHGSRALREACEVFMSRPGNLEAVMEIEGYDKDASVPSLVVELIAVKKYLSLMSAHE